MRRFGLSLVALLGLSGIGCEDPSQRVIHETEIKGPLKIRLIHHDVTGDTDYNSLEGIDSQGNTRFRYKVNNDNGSHITDDDGNAYQKTDGVYSIKKVENFKKPGYSEDKTSE